MNTCDFSPMKHKIEADIKEIIEQLEKSLNVLQKESNCLLGSFEEIKNRFVQVQSVAASFYMNCYLSEYTAKYEDISRCIQQLSLIRHGALLVIERSIAVDSFIQKGTLIRAELTPQLLATIFYPGNPLHDGAVLIRGNEIVSAANILPLTKQQVGEKKLGTRHRAALGLSEQCDAVILVVSEETGKISFTIDGSFYPISTSTI
ncbi:sporulation-specific diadenylate cyclase CdaS [Peribacillus loiseleuriae]|uniref:sporulation-specific diadenylate cyclase CdaS n=1 Tax=Peribacillus loiseleuriae TaxID=1679170 RepID=UPI003816238B